jgi:hypothetical protein
MRVVPALDVAEDGQAGLGLRLEGVPVEQLALEAGEEGLAEGFVVGVPDRCYLGPRIGLLAPPPKATAIRHASGERSSPKLARRPSGTLRCLDSWDFIDRGDSARPFGLRLRCAGLDQTSHGPALAQQV